VLAGEYHRNHPQQTASAVLKAPAEHELMGACLALAQRADPQTVRWGQIGPMLLHAMVQQLKLDAHARPPEVFCPIPWWDWNILLRENTAFDSWVKPTTYAIHLWHELWRSKGIGANAKFPPASPIVKLQAQYGVAP